jgi:hypothetical protein
VRREALWYDGLHRPASADGVMDQISKMASSRKNINCREAVVLACWKVREGRNVATVGERCGMVGNGRGKTSGCFKRVGSERVRVVVFTGNAHERGGRSGDSDDKKPGWMLRWSGGMGREAVGICLGCDE